jgi:hypothetical protein
MTLRSFCAVTVTTFHHDAVSVVTAEFPGLLPTAR